jgi:hypothetical protein
MLKAGRFGFLILLLLLTVTSVGAQGAASEVLLYDGAKVLVVGGSGISETLTLPDEARNLEVVADRYVAISPNREYFAFADSTMTSDGFTTTLNIANLDTGECCVTVDNPFTLEGTYIQVGPFSPDSSRLFVAATRWLPDSQTYESAFLIIDAATGALLQQTDPQALWGGEDNTSLLPQWTNQGITLYPSCIPCEGTFDGTAWRLNPDTGEADALDTYYTGTGDWLAATGEYIYAAENDDYAPPSGNFPVNNNVIEYRDNNGDPQVIYHQPGQFVPRPMWGLDGAAYMLQAPMLDNAIIVDRRGMAEAIELPAGIMLLAGTSDGWLLWSQSDGSLYHVTRWTDGLIHAEVIGSTGQSAQPPQVLQRPALGVSVADDSMASAVR